MALQCEEYKKRVEERIEKPIKRRRQRVEKRCKKRKCRKLCLCCNKWFCWLATIFYWVIEWIVKVIVKYIPYTLCKTVNCIAAEAGDLKRELTNEFNQLRSPLHLAGASLCSTGRVLEAGFGMFGCLAKGTVELGAGIAGSLIKPGSDPGDHGKRIGPLTKDIFSAIGEITQIGFCTVGGILTDLGDWLRCKLRTRFLPGTRVRATRPSARIEHLFILMLENRSFDHLLGFHEKEGIDKVAGREQDFANPHPQSGEAFLAQTGARNWIDIDPPHGFELTREQIADPNMRSFVSTAIEHGIPDDKLEQVMRCYTRDTLPVLHELAAQFMVCDRWFASVPGPTVPNRMFMYAASSAGLASSPTPSGWIDIATGIAFENGTILDRLNERCISWRAYGANVLTYTAILSRSPAAAALDLTDRFHGLDDLWEDLDNEGANFPGVVFLEPNYLKHGSEKDARDDPRNPIGGDPSDYNDGEYSCQHPDHRLMVAGEKLIKHVYEALRRSDIWERSALLITYDEGGGFFDHVSPLRVPAAPPGDSPFLTYANQEEPAKAFDFRSYGIRVPTLLVSPLVENGADSTIFDHSSIPKTISQMFGLDTMTGRDAAANDILSLFTRTQPRDDCPMTLPDPFDGD